MSKLYFKKNGSGIESSCTLSVPIAIGRNFKDVELNVIETESEKLIVSDSSKLAAMKSKISKGIYSLAEYQNILLSEAIQLMIEDEDYVDMFEKILKEASSAEDFRLSIYNYMSQSDEDFVPYPESDDGWY